MKISQTPFISIFQNHMGNNVTSTVFERIVFDFNYFWFLAEQLYEIGFKVLKLQFVCIHVFKKCIS